VAGAYGVVTMPFSVREGKSYKTTILEIKPETKVEVA